MIQVIDEIDEYCLVRLMDLDPLIGTDVKRSAFWPQQDKLVLKARLKEKINAVCLEINSEVVNGAKSWGTPSSGPRIVAVKTIDLLNYKLIRVAHVHVQSPYGGTTYAFVNGSPQHQAMLQQQPVGTFVEQRGNYAIVQLNPTGIGGWGTVTFDRRGNIVGPRGPDNEQALEAYTRQQREDYRIPSARITDEQMSVAWSAAVKAQLPPPSKHKSPPRKQPVAPVYFNEEDDD